MDAASLQCTVTLRFRVLCIYLMCRGLKPKTLSTGNVSKQELAEVCRRQSVDEKEEEGQEERMTGLGFMRYIHTIHFAF